MAITSATRKLALVTHIGASVGWLGTVVAFLVLAVVGLESGDAAVARSSYIAADLITRFAIVPLCVAALVTGLIQSLGTAWGLFRNYWVIAKLVLTVAGAGLLFLHTSVVAEVAGAAREAAFPKSLHPLQVQLLGDSIAAIVLLVVTISLSVYKPRGVTPYGWRKQREERSALAG